MVLPTMFLLAADSQFIFESVSETGTITIAFRLWVYAGLFVFSGLLALGGWFIRKRNADALIIGIGLFILLAPSFMLDRATIDKDGMTLRTGIWSAHRHVIRYSDVTQVHLTDSTFNGRGRVVEHHDCFYCDYAEGRSSELRVSSRIAKAAFRHFMNEINARKIPVVNHRTVVPDSTAPKSLRPIHVFLSRTPAL